MVGQTPQTDKEKTIKICTDLSHVSYKRNVSVLENSMFFSIQMQNRFRGPTTLAGKVQDPFFWRTIAIYAFKKSKPTHYMHLTNRLKLFCLLGCNSSKYSQICPHKRSLQSLKFPTQCSNIRTKLKSNSKMFQLNWLNLGK